MSLFKEAFTVADLNGDGTIDAHEIGSVLRDMGTRATVEELRDMVRHCSTVHDGEAPVACLVWLACGASCMHAMGGHMCCLTM